MQCGKYARRYFWAQFENYQLCCRRRRRQSVHYETVVAVDGVFNTSCSLAESVDTMKSNAPLNEMISTSVTTAIGLRWKNLHVLPLRFRHPSYLDIDWPSTVTYEDTAVMRQIRCTRIRATLSSKRNLLWNSLVSNELHIVYLGIFSTEDLCNSVALCQTLQVFLLKLQSQLFCKGIVDIMAQSRMMQHLIKITDAYRFQSYIHSSISSNIYLSSFVNIKWSRYHLIWPTPT